MFTNALLFSKPISNIWLQIPEAEYTLKSLSPSIFFVTLISVIRGYFNGMESLKVTAKSQTIEQIAKILFTFIIVEFISVISGNNTMLMAAGANLAITFATIIGFIYLYIYYLSTKKEIANEIKKRKNKETRIKEVIKSIIRVSLPMLIIAFLGSMCKTIDSVTVVRGLKSFLTESEAKAQYGIIAGKIDTLIMLPMALNIALTTSLIPKVSSLIAMGDMEETKKIVSDSIIITLLIGVPCSLGLLFFSNPILKLLFPNQNAGSFTLQISSISVVFISLEQTLNGIMQGFGKHILPAWALVFGAITKLILNLILIPLDSSKYLWGGINGAAISTVICHAVILAIEYVSLAKRIELKFKFDKRKIFSIFGSAIFMIICSKYFYGILLSRFSEKISMLLILVFAFFIYFLLIFMLKIIKFKQFIDNKY